MGYIADIQQSLQIRRFDDLIGKPESDVTVYDPKPERTLKDTPLRGRIKAEGLAITDIMSLALENAPYGAVAIYEYVPHKPELGEPVAWVELLSPSNKPGGSDAKEYRDKRRILLQSGIVFVEIDYLHESAPTFDRIPRYQGAKRDPESVSNAHPYRIVVVDPRPEFNEGRAYPIEFNVDEPIPMVEIPLNGDDVLEFNFGAAYNKTFEETLYGVRLVDYSQQPLNVDRYSLDDQVRILARMLTILKAASKGLDLEKSAPLPIDPAAFDDAIGRIAWKD